MCGINGIVGGVEPSDVPGRVRRMNQALLHRGPDSNGIWTSENGVCGLGHTRLSIIDLSETGHQPMTLARSALAMVFNGEIYNFPSLRTELASRGHKFSGRSDSEVVLHAFAEWGPQVFRRLNGMFAAAFVDEAAGKVYLVRDRLGIKPLHYSLRKNGLVFSSEIKGLFASGLIEPEPDFAQIAEYMYFGACLGEHTLLRGIYRLPPGSYAEFDIATCKFEIKQYWHVAELTQTPTSSSETESAREVLRRLETSVQSQLISDVPVGVFLSGGIDSSAIVALASRHYGGRLRTYSAGFDYIADADELPRARLIAQAFGTDHHEVRVTGTDVVDLLDRLVMAHDLPFSDAANIPLYQLCEAMGGETKVVLQGDGGDEVFAGYRRYELLDRLGVLQPLARVARPLLQLAPPLDQVQRLRRMSTALAETDVARRMALLLTTEEECNTPLRVLSPPMRELAATQDPFARYRECARRAADPDPTQQMLLTDLQIILPDIFLEKVDRSTMAQSIEVRVPFLDNEVVEFAARLPAPMKVRYGHKKRILRAALRGVVPDEILDAPKAGFGVPFGRWMQGPVGDRLQELAVDPASRAAYLFDSKVLAATLREHRSGTRNHGFLLWKCLQLALWTTIVLDPARSF